ncbi:hypothetical protein EJB05_23161, partial [Eragrostis curvula]
MATSSRPPPRRRGPLENWERLVGAVLKRDRDHHHGGASLEGLGLAGVVPASLGRSTNDIEGILQAADDVQDEDPNVARIPMELIGAIPVFLGRSRGSAAKMADWDGGVTVAAAVTLSLVISVMLIVVCEQAYTMAQNLDPTSDGRGVLQFKTGLASVIKQKLTKKDGAPIDRQNDIQVLWNFYLQYKSRCRIDDMQREHELLRDSGTFSTEMGARAEKVRTVSANLRALLHVLEILVGQSPTDRLGRQILEEIKKIKGSNTVLRGELMPYNILPLDAPSSVANIVGFFPEVRAAAAAIQDCEDLPRFPYDTSQLRRKDIFDLLQYVFGFQDDNIRNQRENVVLMLANAQSGLSLPVGTEPKVDERAVTEVFGKVLDNYTKWCRYLGKNVAWTSLKAKNRKIMLVALYFLIWGEAANVRFLPECLCYIFHNMAKELDGILALSEAEQVKSCITTDGSSSYLKRIIAPIYQTMAAEANNRNNGNAAHSASRNYDDFNEYFWFVVTLAFTGKTNFVEHRTFLHLYHSFHRLWIFLLLMFQCLAIIAFRNGKIDTSTIKILLSAGPAFFLLNFIECCLNVILMFGAYKAARGFAISRLFIRFLWITTVSAFVTYLYVKVLEEKKLGKSGSTYFRIYVLVLGGYAAVQLVFALMAKAPACHRLSRVSEGSQFFQFFQWIYQERHYVGRGLYESISDYARYVIFWLVILACKFTFTYFLQIQPLVEPTKIIVQLHDLQYSWHDFVSKRNKNALTILSLWGPVVAIYLMDIHIWYTLLSALVGGVMGARDRLGEIRSVEMLHERFETFPEAFAKNLSPQRIYSRPVAQDSEIPKMNASIFSPFWNEIIKSFREEDYISNSEMNLLMMPSNCGNLRVVQWPLFLLTSKIMSVSDYASSCNGSQYELWDRISKDKYMAYAVKECYYSTERILVSLVDGEGKHWVERLFLDLNDSMTQGSLLVSINLMEYKSVLSKLTDLTGLLICDETAGSAADVTKALIELYKVVTHEFLAPNLREQYVTWQLLLKDTDAGRLFSRIFWPKDPEMKEQVKRLHALLTIKDSVADIPKNLEARRRLQFFTNSLFMEMPKAKPVSETIPFSVFTPYYKETVLYSKKKLLKENKDGISILFYLQKVYRDEWENFSERIRCAKPLQYDFNLELRFWVSYRGQTLARTARGMMYYRRALMLQSYLEKRYIGGIEDGNSSAEYIDTQGYESSPDARAQADIKFTYVVSCQIYGQQKQDKKSKAADIALLLQRNEALRVAFIHEVDSVSSDGQVTKEYYSKLVKIAHGKEQEIYSVKLPGKPLLGEGKPENQNHAIIFTRGDAIQTIDMNQDNYLEEAMKMRNLLEEFRNIHGYHGIRNPTILGVREHVFTGSVSSLASFMSNQEASFVTLGQRVLAYLKARMHYGHPDVFDRIFHITRGGISKASKVINISEDIYAGFNSTLRQGNITHHEYIQVGKGRDVGLNQIAIFEGKVAGGNGEQVLSRDVYRLGQSFDFFRMLTFFFTTVGYYFCTMMTVLTVYVFLYGRVYLALSGLDFAIPRQARFLGNTAFDAALNAQFLVQIGIFTAVPMIMGFILELGLMKAILSFITMQLQFCSVFFTFSLGTRTHYFGRTILHGGAKYQSTGRGFEVGLLLIIYIAYGYMKGGSSSFILITISSWFLVISWLFAPYIFNPSGFEWQKTVEDFDDWTSWLFYKGGVGVKSIDSWESWWDEEQVSCNVFVFEIFYIKIVLEKCSFAAHIRTLRGRILETILSLRFLIFQYGIVYKLKITRHNTSIAVYGVSWIVLLAVVILFKLLTATPKKSIALPPFARFLQGLLALGILAGITVLIVLNKFTIAELFAIALAFTATGWCFLCLAVTWKELVKTLLIWDSVREIARMYDAVMGGVIFMPIVFFSWFPFVSTYQSRVLFNQAFSRGLEISIILAGNKANQQAQKI